MADRVRSTRAARIGLLAAVIAAGACASAVTLSGVGPPPQSERPFPGSPLRTLPAPAGSTPVFDEAAALATPDAAGVARRTSRPPEFALHMVSTGLLPEQREPWLLAWVITFHGTPPMYRGRTPEGPVTATCDDIVIVDSETGDTLMHAQNCPGT